MIQTLAITQEDAVLVVQEFLRQYAPKFEQWAAIIVGVCAAVMVLLKIITAIIQVVKSKNQLKATMTPLEFKNDIINTMQTNVLDKLQGTFDVDITDKLNPLIQDVVGLTNKDIATINTKMDAIALAMGVITNVMAHVGSLTEEEHNDLLKALESLPQTNSQKSESAHVQFALTEAPKEEKKSHKIAV